MAFPATWKSLLKPEKIYEINARDSLFVPVRLIPMGLLNGNTKYIINSNILSGELEQLDHASFFISTKKNVKWLLSTQPDDLNYFKNGQTKYDFSVDVLKHR